MKINYTCYSIRKFFLIFLTITCQVGIINAGDISDKYDNYLKGENLNGILTLLQDNQEPINHDTDTFINEIKTEILQETAFQLAITKENDELVQELLKFKQLDVNQVINPNDYYKEYQQTALIRSIKLGKYDVAKGIVNHPKFDLKEQNRHPIQILIDIIRLASSHKDIQEKQLALVKLLIEKKDTADKVIIDLNEKNSFSGVTEKVTFLMYTIYCFYSSKTGDITRAFLLKVIPLLIQHRDVTMTNNNNYKPKELLLYIIQAYYEKNPNHRYKKDFQKQILPLMLKAEYVNRQNEYGITLLMIAIMGKQKTLVEKLLNVKDIDVDIEGRNRETAIFYAIENYDKDIFELILNATKDLNHQNKDGQTPLVALIREEFTDQAAHQDAIQKLAQKLKGKGQLDYRPDKNAPTALHSLVLFYIDQFQSLKEMVADEKNKLKKKLKNSVIAKPKYDSEISELEDKVKKYKENLNTASITNMNILVDAGADPTITFEDKDGQEKTAISLITDDLVEEHEELGTLKSSLEEAKENYKKRKEKNKDTSTQDQDPSQNQDEGNGMNIGTVVIIIAAVGSLVVGAIVAVPLLFKKQKATKKDNKQSKDNTAKPKSIST